MRNAHVRHLRGTLQSTSLALTELFTIAFSLSQCRQRSESSDGRTPSRVCRAIGFVGAVPANRFHGEPSLSCIGYTSNSSTQNCVDECPNEDDHSSSAEFKMSH